MRQTSWSPKSTICPASISKRTIVSGVMASRMDGSSASNHALTLMVDSACAIPTPPALLDPVRDASSPHDSRFRPPAPALASRLRSGPFAGNDARSAVAVELAVGIGRADRYLDVALAAERLQEPQREFLTVILDGLIADIDAPAEWSSAATDTRTRAHQSFLDSRSR